MLTAYLGSICGITLNYLLGRYVGWRLLQKYGFYLRLTDEHLNEAHRWFEKYGKVTLFFGYYLPGLRHLTAFTPGPPAWNTAISPLSLIAAACAGWPPSSPSAISWGRSATDRPSNRQLSLDRGGPGGFPGPDDVPGAAPAGPGRNGAEMNRSLRPVDSGKSGYYLSDKIKPFQSAPISFGVHLRFLIINLEL